MFRVATTETGWTSDHVCTEWFRSIFIPEALKRSNGEPVCLIYDGHGSHTCEELRLEAMEKTIHLFLIPPHTSHMLQPLDVGIFGPIQRHWTQICEAHMEKYRCGIHISDVAIEYWKARTKGFQPDIIVRAFQKSGLNPIDPDVFTEEDYGPAKTYSRLVQAQPLSVPIPVYDPTSDSYIEEPEDRFVDQSGVPQEYGNDVPPSASTLTSVRTSHSRPPSRRSERSCSPVISRVPTPLTGPTAPVKSQIVNLQEEVRRLNGEVHLLTEERDAARVETKVVLKENAWMRYHLYEKKDKEGRVTEIYSQVVLSEEGRREAELQRANRSARQREREARETAAVTAKQQQLQRRAQVGSDMAFSGNEWQSIIFNQLLTCYRIIDGDEA